MRPDIGRLELSEATTKPARSYSVSAGVRALHHTRVAPWAIACSTRALQDRAAGAPAAGVGARGHPAHAPVAGLAVGPDQPDRDEL